MKGLARDIKGKEKSTVLEIVVLRSKNFSNFECYLETVRGGQKRQGQSVDRGCEARLEWEVQQCRKM